MNAPDRNHIQSLEDEVRELREALEQIGRFPLRDEVQKPTEQTSALAMVVTAIALDLSIMLARHALRKEPAK